MKKGKKINIIIWGCNPFSKALHHFLQHTNVTVIAFINDDNDKIDFFCEKEVHAPADFKKLNIYHDLPIVIANPRTMIFKWPLLRLKHITQFKESLQVITQKHEIQNELLHPAALCDFLPLRVQHKPVLFGLQGAGNVLFNQLFLKMRKAQFPLIFTRDKRTFFFEILAREYLQIIQQILFDHIHFNDGHTIHPIAWKIGTSHFNFLYQKNNIPCSIYTFNTRDHFAQLTALYHQIPSVKYLEKLQSMRFKTFYIMRNPLDMILSGINKNGGVNKTTGEINMHHFYGTANWVVNQLKEWHPLMPYLKVLRYEDLLNAPIKIIKSMMKQLHLWPSNFLAKKIWQQTKFKQLPNAFKNHFWEGGMNKWELFFNREHLMILKAIGLEKILLDYHYPNIYKKFIKLTAGFSKDEVLSHFFAHNKKRIIYRDEHYDTFQFLKEMHGEEHCVKCGSFCLVCQDHEVLQQLTKIFNHPYLNKIALSGAFESNRIQ